MKLQNCLVIKKKKHNRTIQSLFSRQRLTPRYLKSLKTNLLLSVFLRRNDFRKKKKSRLLFNVMLHMCWCQHFHDRDVHPVNLKISEKKRKSHKDFM